MNKTIQKVIFSIASIMLIASSLVMSQVRKTITISNFAFTTANVTMTTADTLVFVTSVPSTTHTATSSNDGGSTYTGTGGFNGTLNSGSPKLTVFNLAAGAYPYRCNIHTSMTGTITVTQAITTGINNSSSTYDLSAAPNPFNDQLKLNINVGEKSLTQLKIYDLIGKEVTSINLDGKSGSHSYNVDASNLRPGIYFCTVYSEKGIVETMKLFKTNE